MEEMSSLQHMIITELHTRPNPNDSGQRIVVVNGYGTDHKHYKFEATLPVAVAGQLERGNYITASLYPDRTVRALVWAFQTKDRCDETSPELERLTIHDINLNIRVSGMAVSPEHYFVQVGGYPSIGNPYIVEFDAPLDTARQLSNGASVDLLVDADSVARKIVIGDDVIDVTHVGKL